MTPEKAWEVIKETLQLEMPRENYETWVQPTTCVGQIEHEIHLQVTSALARDWLAARMEISLRRAFRGRLNDPALTRVRFVLPETSSVLADGAESQAEPAPESGARTEVAWLGGQVDSLGDQTAQRQALTNMITQPQRVLVAPGYLRRWVPWLGAPLFLLLLGLYQLRYLRTGGRGGGSAPFAASAQEVARWTGLSPRTVRKYLRDPRLQAFLLPGDEPRVRGQAPLYRLRSKLPLTPADAAALQTWLQEHYTPETPQASLQTLATTPRQDFLAAAQEPVEDSARTPWLPLEAHLRHLGIPSPSKLAEALATYLQPASDKLVIPWYFLQHWAPLLTAEQTTLIIQLRDRSYLSAEEIRDTVWVPGGWETLAGWVGLQRGKTVESWFPAFYAQFARVVGQPQAGTARRRKRQAATQARVGQFVQRVDTRVGSAGRAWLFAVALEDPLIPAHAAALEVALEIATSPDGTAFLEALETASLSLEAGTRFACLGARLAGLLETWGRALPGGEVDGDALCRPEISGGDASCRGMGTRFAAHLKHLSKTTFRQESLKNVLNLLLQNQSNPSSVASPRERSPKAGGEGGGGAVETWDCARFLEMGGLRPGPRQDILQELAGEPELRTRFVAWGLYGYAQRRADGQPAISNPVQFALSRFREARPAPAYLRLAEQAPRRLARQLAQEVYYGLTKAEKQIMQQLQHSPFPDVLDGLLPPVKERRL